MAVREIRTIFAIDGQQKYTDAIKAINAQQRNLNAEMKASGAAYDLAGDKQGGLKAKIEGLNRQIDLQRQKVAEARNAMEKSTQKYGENSETTQKLTRDYHNAEAGLSKLQQQLIASNKELALQESKLRAAGDAAQRAGDKMKTVGDGMARVGSKLTMGVTAPIVAAAGASVKAAMDFESSFAGVVKTVEGTKEQLDELRQGILDMSTEIPASANAIASVAEAAGQLGIETDNVLGFTRVMIDLGEATNLTATEGATQLARFANITQMSQKDFDRLGSSIVALGNNFATTEGEIAAMAMRLAGAGKQVGMSEADIMGLAAALSSVGIEAEAGGSAMSKVMIDIAASVDKGGERLNKFASVANMSASEFAKAYKEDAAGAITAFIVGLGKMEERGGSTLGTLKDLQITEVRMRDALLRASGAGDLLTNSIKLSNDAWTENNALTKEAAARYATTESQLAISKNTITKAAISIGESLLPVVADLVENIAEAAESFANMDPEMQKAALTALAVAAALGPVLGTVGKLTSGIGSLTTAWGKFAVKAAEKAALETAAAGLGGVTTSAGGLLAALGPLAVGIGVVAVALAIDYNSASAKAMRETKALREEVERTEAAYNNTTTSIGSNVSVMSDLAGQLFDLSKKQGRTREETFKMVELVNQLNKLYPELSLTIDKQTGALNRSESAVLDLIEARKQELMLTAHEERLLELYKEKAKVQEQLSEAQGRLTDTTKKEASAWTEVSMSTGIASIAHVRAQEEVKRLTDDLNKVEGSITTVDAAYSSAAESIISSNDALQESTIETAEASKKTTEEYAADQEERRRASEEYQKELESKTDTHLKNMGGLEDRGIQKTKLTAKEIKKNLEQQIKDFQEWRQSIADLSSKVPDDVMTELRALGPGFEPIISDLNKMTKSELDAWIAVWREKSGVARDAALEEVGGLPADMAKAGRDAAQGFANGLEGKLAVVQAAAAKLGRTVPYNVRRILEIESPSKVLREIGGYAGEGLAIGLADQENLVGKEAENLASSVISGIEGTEAIIRAQVQAAGIEQQMLSTNTIQQPAGVLAAGSTTTNNSNLTINLTHNGSLPEDQRSLRQLAEALADRINKQRRGVGA